MSREIKAQYIFEKETSAIKFPDLQDGGWKSNFKLGVYDYMSLLQYRRMSSVPPHFMQA